ncbi:helix-turn-helix domain-containing protein [Halogeometricum luteum]|uniref:Helix-turn-helix domain-containing protein n=1 Tax=Halogeometricum luteum TaxID=2950537 RepID=A0ABU2G2E5_9EURY|nr:helix-turn-helix domain-containing protein [Halogeometricum sp. S3BR5-2]MDS0294948.1 helix-turn-helix domain-containing protein [Halogeometricum sp. S3BR5-2]
MVTTITDIRVAANQFPLGRILQEFPDVEIELERIVPTREQIIPLFWVESEREREVEQTLQKDSLVEEISQLTRTPDRILYSVNWSSEVDSLVRAIVDLNVDVLTAEGTANFWEFRLQFTDREQLSQFRRTCKDEGIDIELLRVYNPQMPQETGPLSPEQQDALTTAYEEGYWDVPRGISQRELAALVGISDNSMSQRLRRGTKIAVAELLYGTGRQQRSKGS